MKKIRQFPFLHRLFCLLMAINVLNFSIDTPEQYSHFLSRGNGGAEDLSINKMESLGEVFLEKVLDITNAVPEQDESDHPFAVKVSKPVLDWATSQVTTFLEKIPTSYTVFAQQNYSFSTSFYSSLTSEIDSPPPQRA